MAPLCPNCRPRGDPDTLIGAMDLCVSVGDHAPCKHRRKHRNHRHDRNPHGNSGTSPKYTTPAMATSSASLITRAAYRWSAMRRALIKGLFDTNNKHPLQTCSPARQRTDRQALLPRRGKGRMKRNRSTSRNTALMRFSAAGITCSLGGGNVGLGMIGRFSPVTRGGFWIVSLIYR